MTNAQGGEGNGGNGDAPDEEIERLFAETIRDIPLGRLAEQYCDELVRARAQGKPLTRTLLIAYIAALGTLMRKSQYVAPDKELAMELAAAKPFLKRLGAAFEPRGS